MTTNVLDQDMQGDLASEIYVAGSKAVLRITERSSRISEFYGSYLLPEILRTPKHESAKARCRYQTYGPYGRLAFHGNITLHVKYDDKF